MNVETYMVFIICFFVKHSNSLKEIKQILDVMPEKPLGTIVFLHCGGDTGPSFKSWLDVIGGTAELFTDMHLIFPTGPEKVYSPFGNQKIITLWYNEDKPNPEGSVKYPVLDFIAYDLVEIIRNETQNGIPLQNVFIGGFGMGGTMAMHIAYRFLPEIGGCFVFSSYLKHFSRVYKVLKKNRKTKKRIRYPALFIAQGESDYIIKPEWSAKTFVRLRRLGIEGSYFSMPQAFHEVIQKELIELDKWILTRMGRGQ